MKVVREIERDVVRGPYLGVVWSSTQRHRERVIGRSNGAYQTEETVRADAVRSVRREALKLGLGASGQVFGGEMQQRLVYHVRVAPGEAGKPTLIIEDV
jgi:hypothetical protein